jgi:hypothetical protein
MALALLLAAAPVVATAQVDECAGLAGQAQGLCRAAAALGCDGSGNQGPACTRIEEKYTEITGTPPPWVRCPCGTGAEFAASANTKDVACRYESNAGTWVLKLNRTDLVLGDPNVVFSFTPGSFAITRKQTCGFHNESLYSLSDTEAASCIAQIGLAANLLATKCPEAP